MRAIFGRGVGGNVTEIDRLRVNEALEPITVRERVGAMLRFMPNLVGLCGRLIADTRVSKTDKALFASAIVYALAPLDLMPDLLPFIGQVDDAYLIALTLLRMIDRADETIVREHWRGGGDPVLLARSLAGLAPMLLPRRISRVLSAKIELAPLFKPAPRGREAAVLVDYNPDDETKALLRTATDLDETSGDGDERTEILEAVRALPDEERAQVKALLGHPTDHAETADDGRRVRALPRGERDRYLARTDDRR